ncbi:hypothetical protein EPK97_20520 [Chengkuizengella sediminis]|nr:hypothetical protein [Chengkuizengella sediminis]
MHSEKKYGLVMYKQIDIINFMWYLFIVRTNQQAEAPASHLTNNLLAGSNDKSYLFGDEINDVGE